MEIVGIDVGFGDVKAVTSSGRKIKFPTAVAIEPGGVFSMDGDREEGLYTYNGTYYYVGNTALHMGRTFSTRSSSFLEKFTPLLAHVALDQLGLGDGGGARIAVGLPLADYNPVNKAFLAKAIMDATVSGRKIRVSDIDVFPQGVGVLFDFRLNDNGDHIPGTDLNTIVVDVGFNTVDVVVAIDGKARRGRSDMIDHAGISMICEKLVGIVRDRTGLHLTEQQAKDVLLQHRIEVYGNPVDFSHDIASMTGEYVNWLLTEINSRWEDSVKQFKKLIVAGGGANIIKSHLPSGYGNLYIPVEPEFANARGFCKASMMVSRKGV